jgi:hypothetical protein
VVVHGEGKLHLSRGRGRLTRELPLVHGVHEGRVQADRDDAAFAQVIGSSPIGRTNLRASPLPTAHPQRGPLSNGCFSGSPPGSVAGPRLMRPSAGVPEQRPSAS